MTQTIVKVRKVSGDELIRALKSLGVVPENATVTFELKQDDGIISFDGVMIKLVEKNDSDELFKL